MGNQRALVGLLTFSNLVWLFAAKQLAIEVVALKKRNVELARGVVYLTEVINEHNVELSEFDLIALRGILKERDATG